MNLDRFLSEVTSHQKHEENPRVVNSEGSDCMVVEYHGSENLIVIYFNDDVTTAKTIVTEEFSGASDEMLFKGLDIPLETL